MGKHREILIKAKGMLSDWETGSPHYYKEGVKLLNKSNKLETIDEETICQYVGLEDKEGNKIYENDVIQVEVDEELQKWIVYYSKVVGQFRLRRINGAGEKMVFPANNRGSVIYNLHDKNKKDNEETEEQD